MSWALYVALPNIAGKISMDQTWLELIHLVQKMTLDDSKLYDVLY
jgi:hypothetical protein